MACERLVDCAFFLRFRKETGRDQYRLLIASYCQGNLRDACKRLEYERVQGKTAPPNLCPSGYLARERS